MLPYWTEGGIDVAPLALDGTVHDDVLVDRYRSAVEEAACEGPVVLGGFSLGARIAALSSPAPSTANRSDSRTETTAVDIIALIGFGFPFHRRADAGDTHGLRALELVDQPTLIVQGTRDPHGTRQQVRSYTSLPSSVRLHWLADGNHHLQPRERSGLTKAEHLAGAARITLAFVNEVLETGRHD